MGILFYSTKEVPYGCFSNFSAHPFELDGALWPTSEHYFQAQKFAGTPEGKPHVEEIRAVASPMQAAKMGRERHRPLRADWEDVKDDVMRRAVFAKFSQHDDIRQILLDTGEEELIENTTDDYYWGRGTKGSGKNLLGLILMEVRQQLWAQLRASSSR